MRRKAKDARALEIYQDTINAVSDAVITGNFDEFEGFFALPHEVQTKTDLVIIDSRATLREHFEAFYKTLWDQNITHYIRTAQWAHFEDATTIKGRHMTHILRQNASRLVPPYPSLVTLVQGEDGVWRAKQAINAFSNSKWPIRMPRVSAMVAEQSLSMS